MAKKRKLDEFLQSRRQNHEAVLEARTQFSNRLFRYCVGVVVVLLLLVLARPERLNRILGLGVLFGMLTVLGTYTLKRLNPNLFPKPASFNHFVLLVVGTVFAYKFLLAFGWSPYLSPLPILGMVVGLAYSQVGGVLVVLALGFYMTLLVPDTLEINRASLAATLSLGGVVSVLGLARVRQQSQPVIVGLCCGAIQAVVIACFQLLEGNFDLERLQFRESLINPGYGLVGGIICGFIVTSLLPVIERFFGVVTERRLLGLSDPSNRLLRVLRERAPGTFQHTLNVQRLASPAAEVIGADVLLTEVGAYYHDIGKMCKPEYFVENMGEDKSIHDRLRPSMSKMIIISHVKDGILLAKEEKLPDEIVDMIPMHHGTTIVEFFYRKARKESNEEETAPSEDVDYRYPGPKPRFAEAGVLMLADAVEAIAKTMVEPTSNRFRDMVREVIMNRLEDGQLDECNLTIADLRKIEDSFVRTLTNMYHNRIDYSKADETGSGDVAGNASRSEKVNVGGLRAS